MAVPNIFGTATAAIPLSQLDQNFATAITLGNTAVYLGNTTTSLGNVTLTNVTISSGNVTLTGANVSGTANVSTLIITGNQTSLGNVSITGNVSANIATFGAGTVALPAITTTGDTNTGIFFPAADTIAFTEGGAEAMRIDSSGNVGIGTSSPSTKLDVSGAITALGGNSPTGGFNLRNVAGTVTPRLTNDGADGTVIRAGASGASVKFNNFANTTEMVLIDSSGNLLVGTTTATSVFTVASSGANIGYFNSTATNGSYSLWANSSTQNGGVGSAKGLFGGTLTDFGVRAENNLIFGVSSTERMRIDSSGNVGIGTSSPTGKLHVSAPASTQYGTFDAVTASSAFTNYKVGGTVYGYLGDASGLVTGGTAGDFAVRFTGAMVFSGGANERMRISSAGIVTMSAYGAGTATFSAAGVISSVSDETWKIKDGAPVDTDAMLQKLEPGYWYYNDEKKETFGSDRQLGFYAQNVNAAIGPEAAPEPEEGKPWGYYDRSVLAVTVMSLQKALATIESLTARIAALESN